MLKLSVQVVGETRKAGALCGRVGKGKNTGQKTKTYGFSETETRKLPSNIKYTSLLLNMAFASHYRQC